MRPPFKFRARARHTQSSRAHEIIFCFGRIMLLPVACIQCTLHDARTLLRAAQRTVVAIAATCADIDAIFGLVTALRLRRLRVGCCKISCLVVVGPNEPIVWPKLAAQLAANAEPIADRARARASDPFRCAQRARALNPTHTGAVARNVYDINNFCSSKAELAL